MPMTAASALAKVKAAYHTRTGQDMQDGDFNVLIDLLTGLILEIQLNAQVTVATTGSDPQGGVVSSSGTGTIL